MPAIASHPQLAQDDFYNHLFRPFLLVEAAAALLGFGRDHIIRLMKSGALRGFNLAVQAEAEGEAMDEREPKSMWRVQKRSVERLRQPELFPGVKLRDLRIEDDLLHRRDNFSIWEVTHTLDCSDDHVRRLLAAGLLAPKNLSVVSDRKHVTRASLLAFLTAREIV